MNAFAYFNKAPIMQEPIDMAYVVMRGLSIFSEPHWIIAHSAILLKTISGRYCLLEYHGSHHSKDLLGVILRPVTVSADDAVKFIDGERTWHIRQPGIKVNTLVSSMTPMTTPVTTPNDARKIMNSMVDGEYRLLMNNCHTVVVKTLRALL